MTVYTPTAWADGVTPVNAANLGKLETGVQTAHSEIAALDTRLLAEEGQPDIPAVVNGKWIKGVTGAMVWSDIVAADVGGLSAALALKQDLSEKAAASGYASLDSATRLVQKATVDKLYSSGISEGFIPVVRSGVTVWEAPPASGSRVVAYAEITADVSITATTDATANTIITAPAFTASGSKIHRIEFFTPNAEVFQQRLRIHLYVDGVLGGTIAQIGPAGLAGDTQHQPLHAIRRLTPAAGSRTYSIRGSWAASSTGTIHAGNGAASAYMPAFIMITEE